MELNVLDSQNLLTEVLFDPVQFLDLLPQVKMLSLLVITKLMFCVCLDLLEADIMERREYAEERRQMIRAFKASVRLEREAGRSDAASFGGITIALLYRVGGGSVMLPGTVL